jgi:hypothetical protein
MDFPLHAELGLMALFTRLAFVAVLLAVALAGKDRAWQRGTIGDMHSDRASVVTGSPSAYVSPENGSVSTLSAKTKTIHNEVKTTELMIIGSFYSYVVTRSGSRTLNVKPGVVIASAMKSASHVGRFIIGDTTRFAQQKNNLYVIDADGQECKLEIIRRERLSAQIRPGE